MGNMTYNYSSQQTISIGAQFKETYFNFFPERATFLGDHRFDKYLGCWNKEGVREKLNFLNHYRDLVKNSLKPEDLILKNICESLIFHIGKIKPYLRPDFFVNHALSSIDRNIYLIQAANTKETQEALADSLVSRVSLFPILFEHSRQWLKVSDPASVSLALYQVKYFKNFLENEYRNFIYKLDVRMTLKEKLIGVIPFTTENLNRFESFIHTLEQIPLESGHFKHSNLFFKNLFKKKYMIESSTSSLLTQTWKVINNLTADLRHISGGNINYYHETLVRENSFPFSGTDTNHAIMAYFQNKTKEYIQFCIDWELFPVSRLPVIEWTPTYKRKSSPLAAYIDKGPYENIIKQGIFWISPVDDDISEAKYNTMTNVYHKQFMNSITIHEVIGHHTAAENLENLEDSFEFSSNITFDEGFALYVEDVFTSYYVAHAAIDNREKEQMLFFQKKAELLRAYRVIVDIGIGTGEMNIEEGARMYSDKNNLPIETALNECEKFYLNPGTASSYFIGKLEILKLKSLIEKKLQNKFSIKTFNRELLNYGSAPLSLIGRKITERLLNR